MEEKQIVTSLEISREANDSVVSGAFVCTRLAEYPTGTLLNEKSLAGALSVSARTVRRMVARCELPQGMPLGGRKVWLVEKILEYLTHRAERLAKDAQRSESLAQRNLQ